MTNSFYKVGADERKDQLLQIGPKNWLLIYGYDNDKELGGYNWRKNYGHKPDKEELKADVEVLVNRLTDVKILSGFVWNGKPVWLSTENQFNFKATYDLAVQSCVEILPVTFKLGEDEDGKSVYHTFGTIDEFYDFYYKAIQWINGCIADGWKEKDNVDYEKMVGNKY